ncbi:MAG: hypothetical protein JWO94_3061 [Verrucomicrobiaceae bacterium]|nr:hypothetical protein [Verrucomicrobiaceae bacterium]
MKFSTEILTLFATTLIAVAAHAQTALVGNGSSFTNIFAPADTETHSVSGGGLLSLHLDNSTASKTSGIWNLAAQGGANISLFGFGLVESDAQTQLTGTSLKFNVTNDANSLLGSLGVGTSLHYGWQATADFGSLTYTPFTTYHLSFDVDGNNGLLSSIAGVTPTFQFELVDGAGNPLTSNGSGALINVAGLLGTGVTSGTVSVDYTVAGSVPTGDLGLRFIVGATIGATALGIGNDFATITNVNLTASPVPEPGSGFLVGALGTVIIMRRRRTLA